MVVTSSMLGQHYNLFCINRQNMKDYNRQKIKPMTYDALLFCLMPSIGRDEMHILALAHDMGLTTHTPKNISVANDW
jgi:hypothetical protein